MTFDKRTKNDYSLVLIGCSFFSKVRYRDASSKNSFDFKGIRGINQVDRRGWPLFLIKMEVVNIDITI